MKLQTGAAAALSPFVPGIETATAVDNTTLEVKLAAPSAALLANLFQLPILPEHFWSEYAKGDGDKLKTVTMDPAEERWSPPDHSPSRSSTSRAPRSSSASTFYGPKPMITGYGFQLFTNADAAIQALKAGEIDCVYQLPPTAADTLKSDANLQIEGFGGSMPETLIVNDSANNKKHPELGSWECVRRSTWPSTARR